jgi:glycosyltransferase involved in cell wall biosynthesis
MRVLHIIDQLHRGGIGEFIFNFYKHSKFEHCAKSYKGGMSYEMEAAGMKHWEGEIPEDVKIDVVVGHGVGGWSYDDTFGWAKKRGCKTVEVMHSVHKSLTNPALCDGFIALSKDALAECTNMPNGKVIYTMSNWVHRNHPYDISLPIGRMSRVVEEKKPHVFVEIARSVPDRGFILGGDGYMLEELKQKAPSNVVFTGWVRDFQTFYNSLGLFVFPTKEECCPMSLAMALAAGVPAIVQDTRALRETTNGYATFCNRVPDFVDAIEDFYKNPEPYIGLANKAHDWAKVFSVDNVIRTWEDYLEEICY